MTFPNQSLITLPSKLCNGAYPLWTILAMFTSKGAQYQIRYDLSVNWSDLYTSTVPVLTGLQNTQFHSSIPHVKRKAFPQIILCWEFTSTQLYNSLTCNHSFLFYSMAFELFSAESAHHWHIC